MLLDMTTQYDDTKIKHFLGVRESVVLQLSTKMDHKKIVSFLAKAGIVSIEDKEKAVYV